MLNHVLCQTAVSDAVYAIDKPYTYYVPDELIDRIQVGMRVMVPFGKGNKHIEALVLKVYKGDKEKNYKAIAAILDEEPLLDSKNIGLAFWMHEQYFCTVYDAVKAMLPAGLFFSLKDVYRLQPDSDITAKNLTSCERKIIQLLESNNGSIEKKMIYAAFQNQSPYHALQGLLDKKIISVDTAIAKSVNDKTEQIAVLDMPEENAYKLISSNAVMQKTVIRMLSGLGEASVKDLRYFTGASMAVIHSLEKKGVLHLEQYEVFRSSRKIDTARKDMPILNEEQTSCFRELANLFDLNQPNCALLYGVTGSGKTQVYIRLIHHVLQTGKSALVLVPEIALTPQMLRVFSGQFGDEIALLHSLLPASERYDEWKRVRQGKAKVVIGTRSAVFAPLQHLGVIILDEEQENSYKSENSPRYHARDIAKYRAVKENALLVLGSATPSVETMYYARQGIYKLLTLRHRYNRNKLPQVLISDLKTSLRTGDTSAIGPELKRELQSNIMAGEQSILFINRRGSSQALVCVECGESPSCPNCTVKLTYHKANSRLMCHYCGYTEPVKFFCPSCGGNLIQTGAGTQRVQEELEELFPGVEIMRMDADTVSASHPHDKMLERFRLHRVPVLVGTQMVAKGLDFENVTLVGVISADQSLYIDDYRASERTFSLLTQVVGRSGRGEKNGRAVLQTYTPHNDVILTAARQDYDSFYEQEIQIRDALGMPPFRDMYVITVSGKDEHKVLCACMKLKNSLSYWMSNEFLDEQTTQILGPAAAPVLVVNKKFRYRITILGKHTSNIRKVIGYILKSAALDVENRSLTIIADVNPMD